MAVFGCIADDFTGASDAASFLVKGGMPTQLFNGIPQKDVSVSSDIQAVVIALKTRTMETSEAVSLSLHAFHWLKEHGITQFYLKYCSTFDSAPKGNIGPVADAIMEALDTPYTILCPALPVNLRTVSHGKLYVNGVPLHESSMKNHPLTPMWDCSIARLMEPQSKYPCLEIGKNKEIQPMITEYGKQAKHFYLIPDYDSEEDGERIADLFFDLPLLTGGSGLLEPLARIHQKNKETPPIPDSRTGGPAFLIAGSCSQATLGQIAWYQKLGKISRKIDPKAIAAGTETVETIWDFIRLHQNEDVLIYSSDTAGHVREAQAQGGTEIAALLEETAAALAKRAADAGYRRIIVAGGETSGAVTKRLGYCSYEIGASAAPGVPIMIPTGHPNIRLVLKSGNFGQADFFTRVLSMTEKGNDTNE